MSDDSKIQFDVELNEGSVESSFDAVDKRAAKSAKESAAVFGAEFQRMENELKDSIASITKATNKESMKSAKESAAVFEEAFKNQVSFKDLFSFKGMADVAGGFYLLKEAATTAGAAVQGAINTIVAGEADFKLDVKFRTLAEQAGIAADVIQNNLTVAARGFIDSSTLLSVASEAFIQVGNNAKQLPQVLEVALKVYRTFGGDVVQITQQINQAIFSGNTRSIRQLGLLIDSEKAYKEYARTLGTVAPLLTEQQKQTAILNEVIKQGATRFKNVNAEAGSVTDALTRLGVATKEFNSEIARLVSGTIGQAFSKFINDSVVSMGQWKRIIESIRVDTMPEGIDKIRASIANLTASIEYGEQKLASFNKTEMRTLGETISAGVESKKKQLAEYQIQLEEVLRKQREVDAGSPKTGGGAVPSGPSDEEIRRREELTNKIKELNSQVNASDLQLAQNNFQRMQTTSSLEALNFQQKKQANEQYLLQKSQLEKFYSDNGVNDEILRNQGRESLEQTHTNKLIEIQQNYLTQRRQISADVGNEDISLSNAWDQVADGFKAKNEELKKNFKATFQEIGRNAREGLAAGVAQGFAAVGAALVEGKNALEEFAKAFIGTVGQMAIASGTRFILEGYAWSTIPGFQVEGAAMISTGIALATFGGALTALSGAMGANSKSSGGGAGGYDSGGGMAGGFDSGQNGAGPIAPEEIAAQIPKTEVNLTINGNILDRRQTGLEIAQILEEQFADQGLVLKGA